VNDSAACVTFTAAARRLGFVSAVGTVLLGVAYAVTLVLGFSSLRSPQQPIGDPWFSIFEILIILTAPMMVALMVAVHAWAPANAKVFSLVAVVFVSLMAGVTCSVHFVILVVGHRVESLGHDWISLFLSFTWPSVPYALDILAWDIFFALSVMFAAPVFGGNRLTMAIRVLLIASGVLAFAGLSGVFAGNMQLRNIGIAGYAGVFPGAALLLAVLFQRTPTPGSQRTG
jgi:hypothetical protein